MEQFVSQCGDGVFDRPDYNRKVLIVIVMERKAKTEKSTLVRELFFARTLLPARQSRPVNQDKKKAEV
jgi:hypothetical protein